MRVYRKLVTVVEQNARFLVDESSDQAVLVDPGGNPERLLAACRQLELNISGIFLTHAHFDHAGGVAAVLAALASDQKTRPVVYAHKAEKEMRAKMMAQVAMFGVPDEGYAVCPEPDVYIDEGDEVPVGSVRGRVLFTPGHSPGHVSWYFPQSEGLTLSCLDSGKERTVSAPLLIAGDTLFQGSIGRSDLPGGSHQVLMRSIREKILTLPENTLVLPGHGPDTTVGTEKANNPFLNAV